MKILLNNEQTTKKSVFSDITNNEKYNKLENSIFFNQETRSNEISLQELKANKLTDRKVEALVAFMKLLTDKKYEHLLEEQEKKEK